jgi:hypothetical protein
MKDKPTFKQDDELRTIAQIMRILQKQTQEVRARIMAYLTVRLRPPTTAAEQSSQQNLDGNHL